MFDSKIEEMRIKARRAMANAHNKYSNFAVGACILADDGNYYIGCNVENSSFRVTTCAEQNAIGSMIANGGKNIESMVVVADSKKIVTPCGACRQTISEFAHHDVKIYMFNRDDDVQVATIAELLPGSFGADFLEQLFNFDSEGQLATAADLVEQN